jgi:hypothetical protein
MCLEVKERVSSAIEQMTGSKQARGSKAGYSRIGLMFPRTAGT